MIEGLNTLKVYDAHFETQILFLMAEHDKTSREERHTARTPQLRLYFDLERSNEDPKWTKVLKVRETEKNDKHEK